MIAADLAADPTITAGIQATLTLVTLASDYQFLTEPLGSNPYIVEAASGRTIADPFAPSANETGDGWMELVALGGPGYSNGVVGATQGPIVSDETGVIEPDESLLDGTTTFDIVHLSVVEQPVAATPEPSTIALLGSGLLLLSLGRGRKHQAGSR